MLYKQVGTSFIFVDTITTDGSLTYVFSNLEAGACYKVTVNLTGYAEQSHIFGSVNGEENAYFHFSAFVVTSIDMEQKLSEQTLFVNRKDD